MLKRILNIRSVFISLALILCSCANADNPSVEPIHEDSVNLSAKIFLKDFVSQDQNIRKTARIYLLGVLDATEGKSWCDYKTLKTVSLNEFIFEKLKKLPPKELERRAAAVIEESLHELFPCGGKK